MKTLVLAIVSAFTVGISAADKPAEILTWYREKAEAALSRLNSTLDSEAAKITTALVRAGDTATAEKITEQTQIKKAGGSVPTPAKELTALFAQYDGARRSQLRPVQDQAIARIDSLLKVPEGQKLDLVAELGRVRAEVESGTLSGSSKLPEVWVYSQKPDGKPEAEARFSPGGKFELGEGASRTTGRWRAGSQADTLVIDITGSKAFWNVTVKGDQATVERPDVGTRYLRVKR